MDKETRVVKHLYSVEYRKNGGKIQNYLIPADSELNAVVRLGQIYGDDKPNREDITLDIIGVSMAQRGA